MKLLLCIVKAGILQKCLPAKGVETTTHIILVGELKAGLEVLLRWLGLWSMGHLVTFQLVT
jgi:hypothetical protein